MGSDQSSLPAGGPGSNLKSQRDEEIPYTCYSISKPIDGESPRSSPKVSKTRLQSREAKDQSTPKHDIVVVAEGSAPDRNADPELVKLNAIPAFLPIMRGSLNIPTSTRESDVLDKLDHRQILLLCLRYQDHLKQLSEAVAFDQNALCIRIKEIDCAIQMLMNLMSERQKKYSKCAEQFQKVNETASALNRIKMNIEQIVPLMDRLNQVLPPDDQLEPFSLKPPKS